MAPSITWRNHGADSGELALAAYTLGIPHPPGYPLYVLLGKLFTLVPIGDVAYRLNLMSAFFAAGAVALVYLLAYLVVSSTTGPAFGEVSVSPCLAVTGALVFAFCPALWSQATIAEVYTLNAFLVAGLICLLLLATARTDNPRGLPGEVQFTANQAKRREWSLILAASGFGLGLAHHPTIVLLLPAAAVLLVGSGSRQRWTTYLRMALGCLLGLGLYAYLPLRAMADPPINWGDPRSWAGLRWMLLAAPYRHYALSVPAAEGFGRLVAWTSLVVQNITWPGVFLALVGWGSLWFRSRRWALFFVTYLALLAAYALTYNTIDWEVLLLPSYIVLAVLLAEGGRLLVASFLGRVPGIRRRELLAASLALLLLPLYSLASNYKALDLSEDREAYDYAAGALSSLPPDSLVFADGDRHIFALWYYHEVVAPGSSTTLLARGLLQFEWYQEHAKRRHPDLFPQDASTDPDALVQSIIERSLSTRAVYLTDPSETDKAFYQVEEAGRLYRLKPAAREAD
jgi:hypothetical protein